jgi:hypothetical protein
MFPEVSSMEEPLKIFSNAKDPPIMEIFGDQKS